ncbi:MAG TPA: hypothetical protein VJX31_01540 [Casimicrobiaceae bacterium]|nr:hypothetical protein [Casimicrobiaceae bacterium]
MRAALNTHHDDTLEDVECAVLPRSAQLRDTSLKSRGRDPWPGRATTHRLTAASTTGNYCRSELQFQQRFVIFDRRTALEKRVTLSGCRALPAEYWRYFWRDFRLVAAVALRLATGLASNTRKCLAQVRVGARRVAKRGIEYGFHCTSMREADCDCTSIAAKVQATRQSTTRVMVQELCQRVRTVADANEPALKPMRAHHRS